MNRSISNSNQIIRIGFNCSRLEYINCFVPSRMIDESKNIWDNTVPSPSLIPLNWIGQIRKKYQKENGVIYDFPWVWKLLIISIHLHYNKCDCCWRECEWNAFERFFFLLLFSLKNSIRYSKFRVKSAKRNSS